MLKNISGFFSNFWLFKLLLVFNLAIFTLILLGGCGSNSALNTPATNPSLSVGYGPQPNTNIDRTPTIPGTNSGSVSPSNTTSPVKITNPPFTTKVDAGSKSDNKDAFGVIVTGLEKESDKPASLQRVLELSQVNWWYQYQPQVISLPAGSASQAHQLFLVRSSPSGIKGDNYLQWVKFIQTTGHFSRPSYWLIGNEPNVPGQDDTSPEIFAEELFELNRQIRSADPQAQLIGPNVLNWDYTCQGCPGYTSGLSWVEKLRKTYRERYGANLPFDGWSLHTYNLDWQRLPLIDQAQDRHQLEALRQYLDQFPDTLHKPIWLTEFGIIWGYDGLEWQKDGEAKWQALPKGRLRTDLMEAYLGSTLDWLEQQRPVLGLAHWFLYTSYGEPEAFSPVFSGISLFDSASRTAGLTNFGRIYLNRVLHSG